MSPAKEILLIEGKTKRILDLGDGTVEVRSKDDITAGDGARRDLLEGKAAVANITTSNAFGLLNKRGIATHFLGMINNRSFRARNVDMIPLELVVRRIATGSYLKRAPDIVEGAVFDPLVMEFFHKDDPAHDPILVFDFEKEVAKRYSPKEPNPPLLDTVPFENLKLGDDPEDTVGRLRAMAIQVFEILEEAWAALNVQLVDMKIECGWDRETGELLVADVIDNDSWRIWPGGDKSQMKDKQVYRDLEGVEDPAAKAKELGTISDNYMWVLQQTLSFP